MKPITEDQAADLALKHAANFGLDIPNTHILISFTRRIYAEGRLSGTQELGQIMEETMRKLDSAGRRKGSILRGHEVKREL